MSRELDERIPGALAGDLYLTLSRGQDVFLSSAMIDQYGITEGDKFTVSHDPNSQTCRLCEIPRRQTVTKKVCITGMVLTAVRAGKETPRGHPRLYFRAKRLFEFLGLQAKTMRTQATVSHTGGVVAIDFKYQTGESPND